MKFEQMNLDKNIIQALHTLGYEKPLPVQEKVIPNILSGTDCIVKSRTGSGKTASFAIPIIQNLEIDERSPQALVLTPTRELALQIQQDLIVLEPLKKLRLYLFLVSSHLSFKRKI